MGMGRVIDFGNRAAVDGGLARRLLSRGFPGKPGRGCVLRVGQAGHALTMILQPPPGQGRLRRGHDAGPASKDACPVAACLFAIALDVPARKPRTQTASRGGMGR